MLDKAIFYTLMVFAFVSTLSIAGQNICTSLALLLAIIKVAMDRKLPNTSGIKLTGIAVYFAAMTILLLFSTNMQESAAVLLNFMYRCSIFFVAFFFIKSKQQVEMLINALLLSIAIADVYAIFQWIKGAERSYAFFSHTMGLAGCLVLLIPLALVHCYGIGTIMRRVLVFLSLLLSCMALIANKTRGAWIAIAAIPFILSLISLHKRYVIGGLVLILLGSICYLQVPVVQERVVGILDLDQRPGTERLLLWHSSLEMAKDYPFTGVGLGEFGVQYRANYISPLATEPQLPHAHNNFLQVLAETGVIGFMAFCYMFYTIIRQHYLYIKHTHLWTAKIATAGFLFTCTLLIQGMTEYNFSNSAVIRLFWFLTGMVYAVYRFADSETEKDNNAV